MEMKFEWDEKKNSINQMKHGVSFKEAATVLSDPNRYELYDRAHSLFERRWLVIGINGCGVLTVCFTERKNITRIISARKANKNEKETYFNEYDKVCN